MIDDLRCRAKRSESPFLTMVGVERLSRLCRHQGRPLIVDHESAAVVLKQLLSPDDSLVAWGDGDGRIHVEDLLSGESWAVLEGHDGKVTSAAFNADGRWIASGGEDQTVRLWDTGSGKCVTALRVDGTVHSVAWSPADGRLAVGGNGGLYVLDILLPGDR